MSNKGLTAETARATKKVYTMKIAICEDNATDRRVLTRYVRESFAALGQKVELFTYENGEDLLADSKKHSFSILFSDIGLPGQNGIEVALKLRKSGSKAAFVFTTVTQEYMAQSYSVWAVHYLVKPVTFEEVDEAARRALSLSNGEDKTVDILVARHTETIPLSDIYYIEGSNRQCIVCTSTGNYTPYVSVKEMLQKLDDERFVHCHRSYIVNMDHVIGVRQDRAVVRGDILIPIRRGEVTFMRKEYEARRIEQVRRRP